MVFSWFCTRIFAFTPSGVRRWRSTAHNRSNTADLQRSGRSSELSASVCSTTMREQKHTVLACHCDLALRLLQAFSRPTGNSTLRKRPSPRSSVLSRGSSGGTASSAQNFCRQSDVSLRIREPSRRGASFKQPTCHSQCWISPTHMLSCAPSSAATDQMVD